MTYSNQHSGLKIAHVVYTFGCALFAGLLYSFEQGVVPMLSTLNAQEYAKVERSLIINLDGFPTGVIVVATITMFLPIYPLIKLWSKRNTKFWKLTFAGWVLFFFGVSLFTIVLNVPINEQVKKWDQKNPPMSWTDSRDQWSNLNKIRTPINYTSLILFILATFEFSKIEE
jgi:uncharacterized membrane protein